MSHKQGLSTHWLDVCYQYLHIYFFRFVWVSMSKIYLHTNARRTILYFIIKQMNRQKHNWIQYLNLLNLKGAEKEKSVSASWWKCACFGESWAVNASFIFFCGVYVARFKPAASSDAALSAAPCINIYPRDVCPCSATAKPLSRRVKFTSFSPLSIFQISPIPFMQFISHLTEDSTSTCSSSPGCWIRWLWLVGGVLVAGWGVALASSIAILIHHSTDWCMSDCRQRRGRCRLAITMN